jgi:uncharacterized protein YbdZ (MbtH family)
VSDLKNPFDDEDGTFRVLVNGDGEHCIWPVFADTPDGWTVARDDCDRATALAYVEQHWTDMRPLALRERPARESAPSTS